MAQTSQNFAGKKSYTAAKVLPPKLPPRAAMSPLVNAAKTKNLLASQTAMVPAEGISPLKDNIYFAHQTREITQTTPATEIVYKRGARSISRKRTDN